MLNIVLLEPEIPQNTGNIGRSCVATNAVLHLIEPLGFSFDDKYLKRAGMDYWKNVSVKLYTSYEDFIDQNSPDSIFFVSTKSDQIYSAPDYSGINDVYFMFGKESAGIPEQILKENYKKCIRIPMEKNSRSLNLSNSVAIIMYEYLRQTNFEGLKKQGILW